MMNSKYKVIKPFASMLKGEELENTCDNFYEFTYSDNHNTRYLGVDSSTVEELCEKGYLAKVEPESCKNCTCKDCTCQNDTRQYIEGLLDKYDDDLKATLEKAEKGEIPQCVKVEAETVYYNLSKVLKEVLKRLN